MAPEKREKERTGVGEIKNYLTDVNYPVDKERLVTLARNQNAPQHIVTALNRIDDREYNDLDELREAVDETK